MRRNCQGASYPRGVLPEARRWAMRRQVALLRHALADWPRRQAPLLEVNCGNGAFLPLLWQWGFDAQGVEACPALRQTAQKRPVPGLEVHAAGDTDLPFANDSYDWVILHLVHSGREAIGQALAEGARLARRGLMVTFWNSSSLPALLWRLGHKKPWLPNAVPWREAMRLMPRLGRIAVFSTLWPPVCAWRWSIASVNLGLWPMGAWCLLRLDMGPTAPLTPLPLRLGAAIKRPWDMAAPSPQTDNREIKI